MEDWKNLIGTGIGVLCFIYPEISNGALLTDDYLGTMNEAAVIAKPNVKPLMAEQYGIYPNSTAKKIEFLRKIKQQVFRVDAAEYVFNTKIYYNSTLDQLTTFQFLLENDFNTFLTHPDTIEMTDANGADFLNYLL